MSLMIWENATLEQLQKIRQGKNAQLRRWAVWINQGMKEVEELKEQIKAKKQARDENIDTFNMLEIEIEVLDGLIERKRAEQSPPEVSEDASESNNIHRRVSKKSTK